MERGAPGAHWPFPRGAWLDAGLNGGLVSGIPLAAGEALLAQVKDHDGAPQGTELLDVEVSYLPDEYGRFFKARHVGASDPYFAWYGASIGQRGGRPVETVYHLCACRADRCQAVAPPGAVVEHLDAWQLVDPRDRERERSKLHCLLAAPGTLVMAAPPALPAPEAEGEIPEAAFGEEESEEAQQVKVVRSGLTPARRK